MKNKKFLHIILSVFALTVLLTFCVSAASVVASGNLVNNNYKWSLTDDGTLTLTGSGVMPSFASASTTPFYSYKNSIKKVVVGGALTTLPDDFFNGYTNITEVTFNSKFTSISRRTFAGCTGLSSIMLPISMVYIWDDAFYCTSGGLKTIYYEGSLDEWKKNVETPPFAVNNYTYTDKNINYATVTHVWTYVAAKSATCAEPGNVAYYINGYDGKNYATDKTTVLDIVEVYVDHTPEVSYTWASDYSECYFSAVCSVCGYKYPSTTSTGVRKTTVAATCTTDSGISCYASPVFSNGVYKEQTKFIPNSGTALGHNNSYTVTWASDYSTCTKTQKCSRCGETIATQTVRTTTSGSAPTCTDWGNYFYYATFTDSHLTENRATESYHTATDPLGHNEGLPTYALTYDKSKMTAKIVCTRCGEVLDSETADAMANVASTPTCTSNGTTNYTATFTKSVFDSAKVLTVTAPATGHTYVDGVCSDCGMADLTYCAKLDGVYQLDSAKKLSWFVSLTNVNKVTDAKAILTSDIDMTGIDWYSINSFDGVFDGNGYTITGLGKGTTVGDGARGGLVAVLGNSGVIKNTTFDGADVFRQASYRSAVIAGESDGEISGCIVKNSLVQSGNYNGLAGIAGKNGGTISNCGVIDTTVTRRFSRTQWLGGIAHENSGSIENCYTYNCSLNGGDVRGAIVATGNRPVSCYYYTSSEVNSTVDGKALTQADFASGAATYLLNVFSSEDCVWYQTVGEGLPSLSGSAVYLVENNYTNIQPTDSAYIVSFDGKIVTVKSNNITGSVIFAAYDSEGKLLNVSITKEHIFGRGIDAARAPDDFDHTGAAEIRVMIFKSGTVAKPLVKSIAVKAEN